jgi:hypothetical protein
MASCASETQQEEALPLLHCCYILRRDCDTPTVLHEVAAAGPSKEARVWRDALLDEGRHQVPLLCAPADW